MRIYYLSTSTIPSQSANSVHVMRMCRALARCGEEVTLFAARGAPINGEDPFRLYDVEENFRIAYASWPPARTLGGLIYGWGVKRSIQDSEAPDFLYARHLGSLFMVRHAGVPFAYEAHQPPRRSWQRWMLAALLRHTDFQFLVVISEALKQRFQELFPFFPAERILVCHDGADPMDADAPAGSQMDKRPLQAGYIGSLYKGRGIEIIIHLARRFPSVSFEILGGSTSDIAYWQRYGTPPNLEFLGFVPQREVLRRYPAYDILLAPYQEKVNVDGGGDTSRYMSPLKIFEYMAAGKAIITSHHTVLQEVLEHRHNALLCDPNAWDSWVRAFGELVEAKELRRRLGQNARTDLLAHYTWEKRAGRILEWISAGVTA